MDSRAPGPSRATATLAQLKALADPLRYRIFENLISGARTAKQMAEQMGTPPTRLYHHFHVLRKAGLIRAAGTRPKRGTIEKYFEATVDRIEAGGASVRMPAALIPALLEGVLGSTLADLQRAAGGPRADLHRAAAARRTRRPHARPYLKRYRIRVTPRLAAEIRAQLDALSRLCERASAGEDDEEFGVTLAFYALAAPTGRRKAP
jgi:DNA-binding transcriptional ArsR family regulator